MLTRIVIVVFCLNFVSGGALFGQIARLPALVEHFRVHQQEQPDTTFVDFIWLHYVDAQHPTDPHHNHHSLPFHHHCGQVFAQFIAAALPISVQPFPHHSFWKDDFFSASNYHYSRYLPTPHVGTLFQPPRA